MYVGLFDCSDSELTLRYIDFGKMMSEFPR